MEITREALDRRLLQLQKGRDEILIELHATSGAIQEVEYWLGQLELKEKEVTKNGSNESNPDGASD